MALEDCLSLKEESQTLRIGSWLNHSAEYIATQIEAQDLWTLRAAEVRVKEARDNLVEIQKEERLTWEKHKPGRHRTLGRSLLREKLEQWLMRKKWWS